MKKKTIIHIIIVTLLALLVIYIGKIVTIDIYAQIDDYCRDTNETIETEHGTVDCYNWNIGNYTAISDVLTGNGIAY